MTEEEAPIIHPIRVLQKREVLVSDKWKSQCLVQWDADMNSTWEFEDYPRKNYPDLDLEDKVTLNGKSNVMKEPKRKQWAPRLKPKM